MLPFSALAASLGVVGALGFLFVLSPASATMARGLHTTSPKLKVSAHDKGTHTTECVEPQLAVAVRVVPWN